MTPTPVPTGQLPVAASFQALSGQAVLLDLLVVLAMIVLITPLILSWRDKDFFKIPYISWFLVHYGIAALAIIAILILGLAGVITGEVISALFGSLLGYVLGSASSRADTSHPPLTITTVPPLPNGAVGAPYSHALAASGGTSPYAWSVSRGTLPAGMNLANNGTLSGTPTAAGTSTFTVQVRDAAQAPATKDYSLTIA